MAAESYSATEEIKDRTPLLVAQYESLRTETCLQLSELNNLFRFAIISVGGTWAWVLTQSANSRLIYFLPLALTCVFALRHAYLFRGLARINEHLAVIERHLNLTKTVSWGQQRLTARPGLRSWITGFDAAFWVTVAAFNLAIGLFLGRGP